MKERDTCRCIGYCIITHTKHNFFKSKIEEFFLKIKSLNEDMDNCTISESGHHGAIRKRYTCNQCDKDFSKQGDLKRHHKREYKLREEKIGEV
jgi:transposase-like protein